MTIEDMKRREEKWQRAWESAKAFDAVPKGEKFFMTVPYPYISGSLHIGHARVVTEADVFTRYQRMTGKSVLFPMAFHISGTPVLGISLAIRSGDQKKIDLYKGYVRQYVSDPAEVERIVKSFENPERIVEFFIPHMIDEFKTLGLSVDWRRSYTSGDIEHQALVEWQFRKYKERGYLKQGSYPILYSITLQNAVGEDDISEGDTNPVEVQEFTLIKFAFGDAFIVAATLRPETMYGQTNMWANPDITYVKARVGAEQWIVSRECAEKLTYQNKQVEILEEIPGTALMGKTCFAPFVEREIPILPSAHCNADIGTGLVTSVPSDAPFDYIALKELQDSPALCAAHGIDHAMVAGITLIPIIESKGYGEFPAVEICKALGITSLADKKLDEATQEIYKTGFHTGVMRENCGAFAGMRVAQAKDAMRKRLNAEGRADTFYETSRKAKSRDGGKVIVAILEGQWFLDFNAKGWKQLAHESLANMELWPEKYRQQFKDVFDWLDKRPCARKRGLGTNLPFDQQWVIESLSDSTIYMALYPIMHIVRRERLTKEQFTDSLFEFVMNKHGTAAAVAKETGVAQSALEEMQAEWQYWYPFDHRHTFTAHLSNHLSFMIFAHTACFERAHWPRRISFHGMIISEGEKMSKSKGNVISLLDIRERFGADSFRAFMCNSTSVESTFNWQSDLVEQMRRHLDSLFELLASVQQRKGGTLRDAAFISKTNRAILKATAAISRMDLREYSNVVLYEMLNNYKQAAKTADVDALNAYVGNTWISLLAPLVPHMAEELWQMDAANGGFVSVMQWPVADESLISDRVELDEEFIEETIANIRRAIAAKNAQPNQVVLYQAEEWKYVFVTEFRKLFATIKNPGQLAAELLKVPELSHNKEDVVRTTQSVFKNQKLLPLVDRAPAEERVLLESHLGYMTQQLGVEVVLGASDSDDLKAKNGLPGKPAISLSGI